MTRLWYCWVWCIVRMTRIRLRCNRVKEKGLILGWIIRTFWVSSWFFKRNNQSMYGYGETKRADNSSQKSSFLLHDRGWVVQFLFGYLMSRPREMRGETSTQTHPTRQENGYNASLAVDGYITNNNPDKTFFLNFFMEGMLNVGLINHILTWIRWISV